MRKTINCRLDTLYKDLFTLASSAGKGRARIALGSLLIFVLLFLVYRPILPGNFLMDDHRLVKEDNGLLNGEFTPFNLWFRSDFTLSTFALWLQWLAWGNIRLVITS